MSWTSRILRPFWVVLYWPQIRLSSRSTPILSIVLRLTRVVGLIWKKFIRGGIWSRGIFRRQTQGRSPRVRLWKIPRHSDSPRENFFQKKPRLFHSLSDFGFLDVQGHPPKSKQGSNLEKSFKKPQWDLWHCISQIALIWNQSLDIGW